MQSPSATSRVLPGTNSAVVPAGQTAAERAEISVDELEVLCTELEHARRMAVVGELTSITTHEFNNLLMTILNYAKLGQRHKDEASRDKAFTRILDAASRAAKITGSVLSLAKNRSGHMEPTKVGDIVQDTLLLLEREFRKFRVGLEVNIEPQLPLVNAVGNDLQRVVINLLVNARQATAEGGSVRLSLTRDDQSKELLLSIRDTGSGIPAEVLPRIFDPFFSTKTGPDASGKGGTGVGLSTCKEVIDAHGGRIRVESKVGKGTAFLIRLPALPDQLA